MITVATYDDALEAMNGRPYCLDGIHGTIRIERFRGTKTICRHPSKRGQDTDAYREMRTKLGDDWVTDLTYSERLGEIIADLQIRFATGA